MAEVAMPVVPENANADRAALRMMLEYVEGELRRIGAVAAAAHAALAAASIAEAGSAPAALAASPLH